MPPEQGGDTPSGAESPPELQARFGERLREAPRTAGLTQAMLAELAGLSQQYVARIEAGQINPTLATMASVARVLGVDVGELLLFASSRQR
jgi:transcriptional regulator with XRE-family HTH domain